MTYTALEIVDTLRQAYRMSAASGRPAAVILFKGKLRAVREIASGDEVFIRDVLAPPLGEAAIMMRCAADAEIREILPHLRRALDLINADKAKTPAQQFTVETLIEAMIISAFETQQDFEKRHKVFDPEEKERRRGLFTRIRSLLHRSDAA